MSGRAVMRGSALIFFWRVSGAGLAFITQVLLARWMGAAELGVYVLAFSWFLLIGTAAGAGLPNASIRFVGAGLARRDHQYVMGFVNASSGIVLAVSTGIALLGVLLLTAGSGIVTDALRMPLLIAMLGIPIYALTALYLAVANACAWFNVSFIPNNFLRPLLFLVALAIAAALAPRLTAALAVSLHVAVIAIVTAVSIVLVRGGLVRPANVQPANREVRLWVRTGVPILIVTLFSNYLPELNVILLGAFLPSSDIAIFNASYRIALLVGFGLFAVDAYISPQIATLAASDKTADLQRVVTHATRLRVVGSVAAMLLFSVAGKPLLGLFGEEFLVGYPALMILTLAQVVHAASGPGTRLLSIGGHQDRCLYVFATAFVVLAVMTAWLAPDHGVTGAAVAAFFAVTCWSVWLALLVHKHMQLRPSILSMGFRD